jgi:hypothetical protein
MIEKLINNQLLGDSVFFAKVGFISHDLACLFEWIYLMIGRQSLFFQSAMEVQILRIYNEKDCDFLVEFLIKFILCRTMQLIILLKKIC